MRDAQTDFAHEITCLEAFTCLLGLQAIRHSLAAGSI